jgi:hypothetical protein
MCCRILNWYKIAESLIDRLGELSLFLQSRICGKFAQRRDSRGEVSDNAVPAQTVDATLACSLAAGVWKPKVFLGR